MKTIYFIKPLIGKHLLYLVVCFTLFFSSFSGIAQQILFDFDNLTQHSSLPTDLTVSSITAHFRATSQGYSIQDANTMGFTPLGFSGNCIYPNSINLSDLIISFDQKLTEFSIMYSSQELGCDDSATMRVTAYMNGNLVGTNTKTAANPGTWPVDILSCNFSQGFDSVVIHYDKRPPTCQDYGTIFLADNMRVTPYNLSILSNQKTDNTVTITPNPISQSTTLSFYLLQSQNISITIYDIAGKKLSTIFKGPLNTGTHHINWNLNTDSIKNGLYFLKLEGERFSQTCKFVVVK